MYHPLNHKILLPTIRQGDTVSDVCSYRIVKVVFVLRFSTVVCAPVLHSCLRSGSPQLSALRFSTVVCAPVLHSCLRSGSPQLSALRFSTVVCAAMLPYQQEIVQDLNATSTLCIFGEGVGWIRPVSAFLRTYTDERNEGL